MEQQLQQKKIQPKQKPYKYVNVKSPSVVQAVNTKKIAFFYIGKQQQNIKQLITTFDSGYTAAAPVNAKSMLKRLVNITHNKSLPDFIIAEATAGIGELKDLH